MSRLIEALEAWSSRPISELEISEAMWILAGVLAFLFLLAAGLRRSTPAPGSELELRTALDHVDLLRSRVIILRTPSALGAAAEIRLLEQLRAAFPQWWLDRGGRVVILEAGVDVQAVLEAPPGSGS